jgi:LuxR family transcriptional regulator, maltose regulon positive regulatory protein
MTPQASTTHSSRPSCGLDRLDTTTQYRLAVLVAPQCSGKTAGLKRWAERWSQSGAKGIAWIDLNEADNLPGVFLENLQKAIVRSYSRLNLFSEENPIKACLQEGETLEAGMTDLINCLVEAPDHFTLVMDQYHHIRSAAIHRAVQLLVDYLPPQAHVIIASSCTPPLELARLRVRRQLLELGEGDLAED